VTSNNTRKKSMPPLGFKTYHPSKRAAADLNLDHAATGIGMVSYTDLKMGFD